MRMGLRYTIAALAILAAVLVFLVSAEDEGGVPLIDWIRDAEGSRSRHELNLAERRAEAQALELELAPPRATSPLRRSQTPGDGLSGLRGRAVRLDGSPVAGLDLAAALPARGLARTDEAGEFVLVGAPPTTEVRLDGETWVLLGSGSVSTSEGGEERVLVVAERASLAGRVTDADGRPLEGVLVEASVPLALAASDEIGFALAPRLGRRALTDAQGRYALDELPAVPFLSVEISKEGYLPIRRGAPDTPGEELNVVLHFLGGPDDR